ncbi:MAG: c-type cytochrome [Planctomycetota bacterium]
MNVVQRKLLLGGLVAAFCVQTALVYTDDTADQYETLSADGLRGRQLWHKHNCQTCHQIHGFGGFLGPDLTNAGKRLTTDRITQVLTLGSAQMPAFHFNEDEIFDMTAFLDELSDMGVGVPRRDKPLDPSEVRAALDRRLAEASPDEGVCRGAALFKQNCTACHIPLQATPLGLQTAPDLSTAHQRIGATAVQETIANGRVDRGMPAWKHLGEQQVEDLTAFLKWLQDDRDALSSACGAAGSEQSLPWWEYR